MGLGVIVSVSVFRISYFEVARETESTVLMNYIVGPFWGTHFHHCLRGAARTQVARKPYTRS